MQEYREAAIKLPRMGGCGRMRLDRTTYRKFCFGATISTPRAATLTSMTAQLLGRAFELTLTLRNSTRTDRPKGSRPSCIPRS